MKPFGAGIVTPYHGPWSLGMRRVFARARMNVAKVMIPPGFATVPAHVEHMIWDGAHHVILRTEDAKQDATMVADHLVARGFAALMHEYPDVNWWIQVGNEPDIYHNGPPTPEQYVRELVDIITTLRSRPELVGLNWMAGVPITEHYASAFFAESEIMQQYDALACNVYGHWHVGDTGSEAQHNYERALSTGKRVWIAEAGIAGALTDSEKAKRIVSWWQSLSADDRTRGAVDGVALFTLGSDTSWPQYELRETHASIFATRDGARTRYFDDTGYAISTAFLDYWDVNGATRLLGLPITGEMLEDGRVVQYTERTRLEWHPENPPDWQVLQGHLGREMFRQRYGA